MLKKIMPVSVGLFVLCFLGYVVRLEYRLHALSHINPQVTHVYQMPEGFNEVPIWMGLGQYDRVLALIDELPEAETQRLCSQIEEERERREHVLAAINDLLHTPDTVSAKKGPFYFESTAKNENLKELKMILQLGWLSAQNGFVGWDDIQVMLQTWLDQSDLSWQENPSISLLMAKRVGGSDE